MPSFLAPSEFWKLTLSEIKPVMENVQMNLWQQNLRALTHGRTLAVDISHVLAGKPFTELSSIVPPKPQSDRVRSLEEVEMTLLRWSKDAE